MLYLGADPSSNERVELKPDHLTTHAVCLGMTGSGKTGLGIVALEELARQHVPLLVVDLKGDMINLLLSFPELRPADFEPWLPPDLASGPDRAAAAAAEAERWRTGLAGAGLGAAEVTAMKQGIAWRLVTPGVAAAAPLDILPSLNAPDGWDPSADADGATERVNGVVGGLLSLIGRGGDPLRDRDQVLVASIVLEHWRRGDRIDLTQLLTSIADPPLATLGALPLDIFFPRKERLELVVELNTLIASPAFSAWMQGMPLTMEAMLGPLGTPRGTIICLAHLSERQRAFALALISAELVAWMRRQPASDSLRALLYIDEVHGILPPHPANPPTKAPLLTLLKQGRAFGVGVWLATQNPVDIDYKALGNTGVKLVGRLTTQRDRERALEGLGLADRSDARAIDAQVAGLKKRQFLLDDVRASQRMRLLGSRWAMSYLRGPVTLAEMEPLLGDQPAAPAAGEAKEARTETTSDTPPVVSSSIDIRFADRSGQAEPSVMARTRVHIEHKTLGVNRDLDEWWCIPVADDGELAWDDAEPLSEEPDLLAEPPEGMLFPPSLPAGLNSELPRAEKDLATWRRRRPLTVLVNPALKLSAEEGEEHDAFLERCLAFADTADDKVQERTRAKYERKMATVRRRLEREQDELERDADKLQARRAEEKLGVVEGLFSVLLGSRSLRSAASKAASKTRSAATKRRMRKTAEAAVVESEREIERLEEDLDNLADELQDEIDRIAEESEAKAHQIEEKELRPKSSNVEVAGVWLVWG